MSPTNDSRGKSKQSTRMHYQYATEDLILVWNRFSDKNIPLVPNEISYDIIFTNLKYYHSVSDFVYFFIEKRVGLCNRLTSFNLFNLFYLENVFICKSCTMLFRALHFTVFIKTK